jgi:hypothetical protein
MTTISPTILLNGILQYLGAMPPAYDLTYDLTRDGVINVLDLMACLTLF